MLKSPPNNPNTKAGRLFIRSQLEGKIPIHVSRALHQKAEIPERIEEDLKVFLKESFPEKKTNGTFLQEWTKVIETLEVRTQPQESLEDFLRFSFQS